MTSAERWELTLKTLALVGGMIAGIFAYYKYSETKEREFYSAYWNAKATLYREFSALAAEAVQVAAEIKDSPSGGAPDALKEKYRQLVARYWTMAFGPLTLVENAEVEEAAENFGDMLDAYAKHQQLDLEGSANNLAGALKTDLMGSWRTPFSEFEYKQDPNEPYPGARKSVIAPPKSEAPVRELKTNP